MMAESNNIFQFILKFHHRGFNPRKGMLVLLCKITIVQNSSVLYHTTSYYYVSNTVWYCRSGTWLHRMHMSFPYCTNSISALHLSSCVAVSHIPSRYSVSRPVKQCGGGVERRGGEVKGSGGEGWEVRGGKVRWREEAGSKIRNELKSKRIRREEV